MIDYSEFKALAPFISVIENALRGEVDGERYFDFFAEDVLMEFMCPIPGTPRELRGRQAIIDSWRGYGQVLTLESVQCDNVFKTDKPDVIILQYSGKGTGVQTGKPYVQHYLSILTIRNHKIVHWCDYWDPIVSIEAIGGPEALNNAMYAN